MKCSFFISASFFLTLLSCSKNKFTGSIIYSDKVKDSFEVYISKLQSADTTKVYDVVYYLDANLKSGKKLRELLKSNEYSTKVSNTIFVGIGHIGDYHVLRRRDFILPGINGSDTAGSSNNYGQTENFYQFLKMELIPKINSIYKTNKDNNTIVGHSLGGLFAFYCLFKNELTFKNFYALSPSLWIDDYNIYAFNKLAKENINTKNLYFSAGGLEIFNYIKSGTNKMNAFLKGQNYKHLKYRYDIHSWRTHNSQVEKSLDYLLRNNVFE